MDTFKSSFDDFRMLFHSFPQPDEVSMAAARARQIKLIKPRGALGRLEEIAIWLSGWRGEEKPLIRKPLVAVFAGNHGITDECITPFSSKLTEKMVHNFAEGKAAINQICAFNDLGLKIYDLALEYPTLNITKEAAMDERTCTATMAFGMEAIVGGIDLICLGEMGIGNTTIASALALGLFGGDAEEWIGQSSGSEDVFLDRKIETVRKAVALHSNYLDDPFEVLRRLGGREFSAIVGAILAARMEKIPVILDGFVVTAAAAVLFKIHPSALDHCLVGHMSTETAHRKLLRILRKEPLLKLGMRLGEGTGAALAAGIVRCAALCHAKMATFEQAVF
ncbi:MAG: nicotinate-nucleotide--dimethylbenzimidazole phosphoribosyltransferase [Candidatus Tokpelaia sp. JSC161]|jgi:nicotinate-nucleotide--dimethylbenzimidazole phosphoribosyltransferase|nr:MAG: nicotinate-nucleotide--dimethylbenzimidazole phosphoribosyltransferase [Candidatus Tokpelaia sp. JSC161]